MKKLITSIAFIMLLITSCKNPFHDNSLKGEWSGVQDCDAWLHSEFTATLNADSTATYIIRYNQKSEEDYKFHFIGTTGVRQSTWHIIDCEIKSKTTGEVTTVKSIQIINNDRLNGNIKNDELGHEDYFFEINKDGDLQGITEDILCLKLTKK